MRLAQVLSLFCLLAATRPAFADGGVVLSQKISGPYRITLFASPFPLRAGPADLSVMIQDASTGEPVLDQSVSIDVQASAASRGSAWLPPCCSMAASKGAVPATHGNAQNKLLYAANLTLPASGPHDISVAIGGSPAALKIEVDVEPPPAPVSAYWPYLAAPPLLIGLFALNQRLRRRN